MAYKYISRKGKIHGYYSGETFANLLGVSTQVPMRREIVTNNIAAIVRNITIDKDDYELAKEKINRFAALTKITKADIDKYIRQYPDCTFRHYYELRLDDVFTRR